jgi:hypothetical protein
VNQQHPEHEMARSLAVIFLGGGMLLQWLPLLAARI